MTPTNNWITDRRPTEADGDSDGDVLARYHPDSDGHCYLHWSHVGEATPWRHWSRWQPPALPPLPDQYFQPSQPTKPSPRRFVSVTRTVHEFGHTIDAIDEDGVAWWMALTTDDPYQEPEWHQLTPLPGREVVG